MRRSQEPENASGNDARRMDRGKKIHHEVKMIRAAKKHPNYKHNLGGRWYIQGTN